MFSIFFTLLDFNNYLIFVKKIKKLLKYKYYDYDK